MQFQYINDLIASKLWTSHKSLTLAFGLQVHRTKDSYSYGRNTPTLIFENLKRVEISKNHLNIFKSCIDFQN